MAQQKRQPWRVRCAYVHPSGAGCESVTPRSWEFCVPHTGKLGAHLEETAGTVTRTLEFPELRKQIGNLTSADWECLRLRLARIAPTVTLCLPGELGLLTLACDSVPDCHPTSSSVGSK